MNPSDRRELVLDSIRVGIVAVDREGRVEVQNAEASRILGVSRGVTAGRPLAETLGPRHPAVSLLDEVQTAEREVFAHDCAIPRRIGFRWFGGLVLVPSRCVA